MLEIVFIGRGGQGAVTAANILVEAAMIEGLHAQGFPFFGAERRGAPVAAYARVDKKPILRHGMFNTADVVVVLDGKLVQQDYASQFTLRDKGVLVLNSPHTQIPRDLKLRFEGDYSIYVVNATEIAVKNKLVIAGWPVVNTGMLGALSRAIGVVSKNAVVEAVKRYFGGRVGEVNAKASEDAYEQTVRVV
ncbi:pyruvate/ketoisovalerate ferredoxin oxidoreductase subunit gamma [Thermogladius calderae 1633]|uniref:pyruvate synthase n=1 Tax=Thermogladius calderae (strain DSM 22663 / VKM B-2946 / 1633) TaxID=1184251 RepID=I3TD94_THEC1|nr:2-oxoacid:acceptor oxidoreductase family protein [Thermogladius calderae]AFK50732.1 pyruvate/ketoisovalerate ferredoxin oxidoreductase subunit gamma [Thermogladius calderae 1633]